MTVKNGIRRILVLSFILFFPSFVSTSNLDLPDRSLKKVALTFDDGPRPAAVHRLNSVLTQHNVRGTFFIVGKMAARYPQSIRDLASAGHEIANHSWSHPDIRRISSEEFVWELDATRELIHELTGQETWLFRTPGSTRSYLTSRFRVPSKYTLILWDLHSRDHIDINSHDMTQHILSQIHDGDILLMHTGVQNTIDSLECLIPELKARGFEFVTVSEILKHKKLNNFSVRDPSVIQG